MDWIYILFGIFDIIIAWLLVGLIIRHGDASNAEHSRIYHILTWLSFKLIPK